MSNWKVFGSHPFQEAIQASLVPGDGIAIRLYKGNGERPTHKALILTLVHLDESGFTASDPQGIFGAYRWEQAVAWEKR